MTERKTNIYYKGYTNERLHATDLFKNRKESEWVKLAFDQGV